MAIQLQSAEKIGLFVILPIAILLPVGLLGFAVHPDLPNDVDCATPASEVDEPTQGCYEHCRSVPVWYGLGERQSCYWDDEPPENGPKTGGEE